MLYGCLLSDLLVNNDEIQSISRCCWDDASLPKTYRGQSSPCSPCPTCTTTYQYPFVSCFPPLTWSLPINFILWSIPCSACRISWTPSVALTVVMFPAGLMIWFAWKLRNSTRRCTPHRIQRWCCTQFTLLRWTFVSARPASGRLESVCPNRSCHKNRTPTWSESHLPRWLCSLRTVSGWITHFSSLTNDATWSYLNPLVPGLLLINCVHFDGVYFILRISMPNLKIIRLFIFSI